MPKAFFRVMGEREVMLMRLSQLLRRIARPYPVDQTLPADLQATLLRLGLACDGATPRKELVAQLWDRKRTLWTAHRSPHRSGPDATPPSAA